MRTSRLALATAAIATALVVLPTSGAVFVDATGNDANQVGARRPVRVTTYEITDGVFTGTSYDLALSQTLALDYFVIVRGAAGANDRTTNRSPAQDYARVAGDPFGNFNGGSTGASVLRLERGDASGSAWQGQITVVECLDSQDTAGFRLRGVAEPVLAEDATTANATVDSSWTSISQVGMYGGIQGGGVATTATAVADHITAWGRVYPSSPDTANVERRAGYNPGRGRLSGTTTFTVYAVEWGSEWTVQRVTVEGNNGGQGIDQASEYDSASISPISRANTFVLASGISDSNRLGAGWEGTVFTLGNGVAQNAIENAVSIGAETPANRKAEIYAHTHPGLSVVSHFGTLERDALTGIQSVDAAIVADTTAGGVVASTAGWRVPIFTNSSSGTGTAYPRPIYWARHTADTAVTWTRSRAGQPAAYWLQSVDFGTLWR